MGVLLSAAASLSWWCGQAGGDEAQLLAELPTAAGAPSPCWFVPYLSGERTPHNDADVRGAFLQLGAGTTRAMMTQAVLEGVAYAFRDARDALASAGTRITAADVVGGGARSDLWCDVLANVLNLPLRRIEGAAHGPALGAARLGQAACSGTHRFPRPTDGRIFAPRAALAQRYDDAHARWSSLYPLVRQVPRIGTESIEDPAA